MASTHIEVKSTASRYGESVRGFVNSLQGVVDCANFLKSVGDQISSGSDWATLATYLGITSAEAEAVYNMLDSTLTELEGVSITQMLARLG